MAKAKQEEKRAEIMCPVGRFFSRLQQASRTRSRVKEHLYRSRIEFLKALKCLIDERIEDLEKGEIPRGQKKSTRIAVE